MLRLVVVVVAAAAAAAAAAVVVVVAAAAAKLTLLWLVLKTPLRLSQCFSEEINGTFRFRQCLL